MNATLFNVISQISILTPKTIEQNIVFPTEGIFVSGLLAGKVKVSNIKEFFKYYIQFLRNNLNQKILPAKGNNLQPSVTKHLENNS